MSYDLFLFFQTSENDLEQQAANALELEGDRKRDVASRRDAIIQHRRLAIARAILQQDPSRSITPSLDVLEQQLNSGPLRPLPSVIEIDCPNIATQISLFSKTGGLSIPYWYSGDRAREVWSEIESVLHLLKIGWGLRAHDQQLSKVLELPEDSSLLLQSYAYGVIRTHEIARRNE